MIIQRNWLSENTISRIRKTTKTIAAVGVLLSEKCDNENLCISYFLNLLNVLGPKCANFLKSGNCAKSDFRNCGKYSKCLHPEILKVVVFCTSHK